MGPHLGMVVFLLLRHSLASSGSEHTDLSLGTYLSLDPTAATSIRTLYTFVSPLFQFTFLRLVHVLGNEFLFLLRDELNCPLVCMIDTLIFTCCLAGWPGPRLG
ncbi:hypothetical protein F5883DRAFT_597025 [Diaporthe sp. PMI_573]|nr:hypothetical protein F5883DRAFT_597025 [Diaporthaceae sp. PMI_573]